MVNEAPVVTPPTPSIVNTPAPVVTPAEATLFPNTPTGEPKTEPPPAAVEPVVTPPVTPAAPAKPAEPVPGTKVPTEEPKLGADGKPLAPAPSPTDYTLVLPENSLLSVDDLKAIETEAKALGLPKEKAESLAKSYSGVADKTAATIKARQDKAFEDEKIAWRKAAETDPEMGGEKYAETVALSSRAFKAAASPTLQKLADETGLGSHPEFVRMLAKFGRMMGEDTLVLGRVGDAQGGKSPESVLYGRTTPDASGRKTG